jgi:hypothetical protein
MASAPGEQHQHRCWEIALKTSNDGGLGAANLLTGSVERAQAIGVMLCPLRASETTKKQLSIPRTTCISTLKL